MSEEVLKQEKKPIIFSAIQPSGTITLGNYIGALKNWVTLQDDYDCIFAVADLHAITVRQEPATFRRHILEAYALLLACGIDTEKSPFFIQSHVHTHAELAWVLNCYTQFGELSRMTQFKDKSQKHADNVNVGLFAYPSLMAADILLYQADLVPVGADQKQHLELARNVAERFNGIYGNTFKIPDGYIPPVGARIMSLQDPTKKMSKSDPLEKASIYLDDSEAVIRKKIASAVTDSDGIIKYDEVNKPGISNLLNILSCCTNKSISDLEAEFEGVGYGEFKKAVADAIITLLMPIQEKNEKILADKDYLNKVLDDGAQKASYFARKTLSKVKRKMGVGR